MLPTLTAAKGGAMAAVHDQGTVDWLLSSDDPAARWVALTELLDRPTGDPEVEATHRAVLADSGTRDLIGRLGDWDRPWLLSGHDSSPPCAAEPLVQSNRGGTLVLRVSRDDLEPSEARLADK